jgi:nitroreductase
MRSLVLLGIVLCLLAPVARADSLDALEAILKRTSVRVFDPNRAVSDAELRKIMEAGWGAPTLDGSRPFEFIQIRDRKTLEALAGETSYAKWLAKAPAAIAVVVRTKESPRLYRENGAAAVMNMYYKAQELGLGVTFQGTANREAMKRTLGLADNLHLLTVLPVGAPMPGKTFKSPPRVELSQTVSQEKLGQAATLLQGTQVATRGVVSLGELLSHPTDATGFTARALEGDKLRTALETMRVAPSSKNRQPWRWVLVQDPATKQRLAKAAKDRTLADAPVIAVLAGSNGPPPPVFGSQVRSDPHNKVAKTGNKLIHYFMPHDLGCALANLRLGVEAQGLGVRVAAFNASGESKARSLISPQDPISKHRMRVFAAVGIGYASGKTARVAPKLPTARVHREKY